MAAKKAAPKRTAKGTKGKGTAKTSRGARSTPRPATTQAAEAAAATNPVATPPEKRPVGRPSEYRPEYSEEAKRLCAIFGAIDVQLAAHFGVSEVTINAWKKAHPEFLKALNEGKDTTNEQVERSLVQRALGWEHTAVKMFFDGEKVVEHEYTERYPGDTTAQIFFLKNRMPERYRDKQTIEHEFGATVEAIITESWNH